MVTYHVLEFTPGEEQYCIDIEYVTEVLSRSKRDETSIPESPPHVGGKIDLRGEITGVIDPRAGLMPEGNEVDGHSQDRMIVFDVEKTTGRDSGWAVTAALRILTVDSEPVGAVDGDLINGLVAGEDGQIVRVDPETVSAET